ncbi:hypothetical protein V22_21660 [Calycomorphotria hydatis]|uniref:Uncharacterized protein n=2 Tax=Calycomorphotria hydatis TaxID=2528027 RepID=A0A517T963_9PLAN|nr:hypothetical protein V22_21660 [Calycomorphotria hydatis]
MPEALPPLPKTASHANPNSYYGVRNVGHAPNSKGTFVRWTDRFRNIFGGFGNASEEPIKRPEPPGRVKLDPQPEPPHLQLSFESIPEEEPEASVIVTDELILRQPRLLPVDAR